MARGNPLPSLHETQDLDSYVQTVIDACGCSRKVAEQIVATYPMGVGLGAATEIDFKRAGATKKQAAQLEAIMRLCRYMCWPGKGFEWPALRGPNDVVNYLQRMLATEDQEYFVAIFLDVRQRIVDARVVAKGSLAQVDVHPREVFRDAIRLRAHSMILAHNHPSGDPQPSDSDVELTRRLGEVGRLVGIPVLDHVIVTSRGSVSLASMGVL